MRKSIRVLFLMLAMLAAPQVLWADKPLAPVAETAMVDLNSATQAEI